MAEPAKKKKKSSRAKRTAAKVLGALVGTAGLAAGAYYMGNRPRQFPRFSMATVYPQIAFSNARDFIHRQIHGVDPEHEEWRRGQIGDADPDAMSYRPPNERQWNLPDVVSRPLNEQAAQAASAAAAKKLENMRNAPVYSDDDDDDDDD
jgi:hypothetical protein